MASGILNFLNLAATTVSTLNFQIPAITIKLDRSNYLLWRTKIISALETFVLEDFILNPTPPSETKVILVIATAPTTETSLTITAFPATIAQNIEYVAWKRRD